MSLFLVRAVRLMVVVFTLNENERAVMLSATDLSGPVPIFSCSLLSAVRVNCLGRVMV